MGFIIAENEIYKELDIDDNYLISNFGNILDIRNGQPRYKTLFIQENKYNVVFTNNHKKKHYVVSRLVYSHFIGSLERNEMIIHIDGNTLNNHYKNLKKVSFKEAYNNNNKNTDFKPVCKLSESEVLEIRKKHLQGEQIKVLAIDYNVSFQNIWKIVNLKSWTKI